MSGGGHMQAITQSLRENRKLLRRKKIFDKEEGFLAGQKKFHKAPKGKVPSKKISAEKRRKIGEYIHQHAKKQWRRFLIPFSITLLMLVVLRSFALSAWNSGAFHPYPHYSEREQFKNREEKRKADYLFFINDGDRYLHEKHWNNAIFQYKKAGALYPQEYDANFRLLTAYSYKCLNESTDCTAGQVLAKKLLSLQPDNTDLQEIAAIFDTKLHTDR